MSLSTERRLSTQRGQTDKADTCETCGEAVPVGGWPFCRSKWNPQGHAKGTYVWTMKFSMKTQGWTRRPR